MEKENKAPTPEEKMQRLVADAPVRWFEAASTTLGTVAIFAGIGYYLDTVFATKPWLLIAGLVFAFPVSQYLVYRRLKNRYHL